MTQRPDLHGVRALRARQRGLTLIELMVGILISMILSLAIFSVLSTSEGFKRTTTSVNDISQTGNYAMYSLDKWVRSAGSGFRQAGAYAFGCPLHAARSGTQILPRPAALPAPFASVNTSGVFRLAPVLIMPGQTTPGISGQPSDALIVMSGAAGGGEVPFALTDFPTSAGASSTLTLVNTLSFNANDLILIANQNDTATGLAPCMIEEVAAPFTGGAAQALPLSGGTYYSASIASANVADLRKDLGQVMNLGNVANANLPSFLVIGVGDDNTLYSFDLLQPTGTSLPVAEGVFELQALYGVDNDNNGTIDDWIDPSTTGAYSLNALTAGTKAAVAQLQRIKAVRVGLIMRSALPEKADVAPASITLFSDLSGFSASPYVRSLSTSGAINERRYRYRTIESTIPLRNPMM